MDEIIKKIVTAAGSQEKAANILGVSQAAISQYLAGKKNPRQSVIMLAEAYLKSDLQGGADNQGS